MRVLVALILVLMVSVQAFAHGTIYRLRAGDKIEIWVEQDPNLRRQVLIAPDGRISLPLAGHLRASGLTPERLELALKERLQKLYTSDLNITVLLVETALVQQVVAESIVYVTGEINNPGAQVMRTPTNVLQAIALAGGLGQFAAKKRILIRRTGTDGDILIPFNYHDVEDGNEDVLGNVILRHGDVIVVPERGLFE